MECYTQLLSPSLTGTLLLLQNLVIPYILFKLQSPHIMVLPIHLHQYKSSSHSSLGWQYQGEGDCQTKPLFIDLISNLSCTSSWTCNIFSDTYKLSCLQDDKFIFVLPCAFCYKFVGVTQITWSSHLSSSISRSITFYDNLSQILGCFIVLLINDS